MRAAQKYLVLFACLGLACSTGGSPTYPVADLSGAAEDMGLTPGVDLAGVDLAGTTPDLATPPPPRDLAVPAADFAGVDLAGTTPDLAMTPADLAMMPADLATLPPDFASSGSCSPGASRCAPANAIEVCNVTGTAWLHVATCSVGCSAGLCTGACTAGSRRCNMKSVEECNTMGTMWTAVETCPGSCSSGKCALSSLDVTMSKNLDGEIVVDGDFTVRSGVTVTASSGELTIRARNITVENMGTITVAARGNKSGRGNGSVPTDTSYGGGGGGNGTRGTEGYSSTYAGRGGVVIPSDTDLEVQGGGSGANGYAGSGSGSRGGAGGGVIRLIASDSITVTGFLTANAANGTDYSVSGYGGGGGGAGGGILLAASGKITVTGSIVANGGTGGRGYYATSGSGGAGGQGRVRLLSGDTRSITGTITAVRTEGLLPPVTITSASHPDPGLVYNDDFDSISLSWTSPFSSRQGYYHLINTANYQVPTPATGTFVNTESVSYLPTAVSSGNNYFHITSVDALTNVGKVENNFLIQINTTAPAVSSSSHPSSTTWYPNHDVFFAWTLPVADESIKGIYYVLDHYGSTIPTKAAPLVRMPQKSLLLAGLADGIWVMHVLSVDTHDYLTKAAAHYRVQLGADPGSGTLLGQVTDGMGKAIDGATVTVNRGLWTQTTNATGNYNIASLSAGTYELRTTKAGRTPAVQMITVAKGGSTTANVSMP